MFEKNTFLEFLQKYTLFWLETSRIVIFEETKMTEEVRTAHWRNTLEHSSEPEGGRGRHLASCETLLDHAVKARNCALELLEHSEDF